MVRSLHVFLHPSFRQSVHPSVPMLNRLFRMGFLRVVKAKSWVVKEFEGGEGKIKGGGDIISITLF